MKNVYIGKYRGGEKYFEHPMENNEICGICLEWFPNGTRSIIDRTIHDADHGPRIHFNYKAEMHL